LLGMNTEHLWRSVGWVDGIVQKRSPRAGVVRGSADPILFAAEMVRTVVQMLAKRKIRTKTDGVHPVSAVLANGSRIVGLPGNEATSRELASVSLLLIDEASRVSDAMYHAVRPMLAVAQGDIWLMSTPWATCGFFYDAWEHGGPEWARFSVKATECPRIPAAWLEKERQRIGSWVFRREFMAEFVQDDLAAFDAAVVEEAMDEHLAPMEVDWAEYMKARDRRGF